jgi:hypothetical protein
METLPATAVRSTGSQPFDKELVLRCKARCPRRGEEVNSLGVMPAKNTVYPAVA